MQGVVRYRGRLKVDVSLKKKLRPDHQQIISHQRAGPFRRLRNAEVD